MQTKSTPEIVQVPRPKGARRGDVFFVVTDDHEYSTGGILETDTLVFLKTTIEGVREGDLVAATLPAPNDEMLSTGFFHRERNMIVLLGETPDYDSDFFKPEEIKVAGRCVAVLRERRLITSGIKGVRQLVWDANMIIPQGCENKDLYAFMFPTKRHINGVKIPRGSFAVAAPIPPESGDLAAWKVDTDDTMIGYFCKAANGYGTISTMPRRGEPDAHVLTPAEVKTLWRIMHVERDGAIIVDLPTRGAGLAEVKDTIETLKRKLDEVTAIMQRSEAEQFAFHLSEAMRLGAMCDEVPDEFFNDLREAVDSHVMDTFDFNAPATILFAMKQAAA
jgi:hypothetical protein